MAALVKLVNTVQNATFYTLCNLLETNSLLLQRCYEEHQGGSDQPQAAAPC